MSERFVAGIATQGEMMTGAVKDTERDIVYPVGGDFETVEEYARMLNEGYPNYMIPGVGLFIFQTIEEYVNG
jgi:hypothetical protein